MGYQQESQLLGGVGGLERLGGAFASQKQNRFGLAVGLLF